MGGRGGDENVAGDRGDGEGGRRANHSVVPVAERGLVVTDRFDQHFGEGRLAGDRMEFAAVEAWKSAASLVANGGMPSIA